MDELTAEWQQTIDYDNYHDDRFYRPYVKEVLHVYKHGNLSVKQIRALYNDLIENFGPSAEASETQDRIHAMRKYERRYYHEIIDDVCQQYDPSLTWRQVKFEPSRVNRCIICQSYYYDVSRNGRRLTCDTKGTYRVWDKTNRKYRHYHKDSKKLSVCAVEYELRRRAAPEGWTEEDIIYPHSGRKVQKKLVDWQTNYTM